MIKGCRDLVTTPITGYSSTDGEFVSGASSVAIEFKRRNITTHYPDSFIERTKFLALYQKFLQGCYTLFIVEYDDYYFCWDLQYEFMLYRPYINCDNIFFSILNATKNNYDYQKGATEKDKRDLKYYDATIILNKDFQPVLYNEFIQERIKKASTN